MDGKLQILKKNLDFMTMKIPQFLEPRRERRKKEAETGLYILVICHIYDAPKN